MDKKNHIKQSIGENIFKIRKSEDLKQQAFADKINKILKKYNIESDYDAKVISKWERGETAPRLDCLIALCKEYNLSLDELLKDEIKEIVSKSSFSASEENILDDLIKNPAVCINKNGRLESAFNPDLYRYGQLSYLADNLVEYRAEMSKNFRFTNPTKEVQIVVGILDVNDGKRELHYLGTGENDIVSIENIPVNYSEINIKNNNIIQSITHNDIFNDNYVHVIKLGNGKTYILDEDYSKYNCEDYKFTEDNLPSDLDYYGLNKNDDWLTYAYCKRDVAIDEENLFDCFGGGTYYYKETGIFEIVLFGQIKCTDAQLIKVLTDDYKHRLLKELEKESDGAIFEQQIEEARRYLEFLKNQNK